MKHKLYKIIPVMLISAMLFSGCTTTNAVDESTVISQSEETVTNTNETEEDTSSVVYEESENETEEQEYFSSRDLSAEVDISNAVEITMNGDSISSSSDTVMISGSAVTITEEGTYILSGTLDDGSVIVNTSKEEKVQLVLNGVSINSDTFAAIYVAQADKVFITLAEDTVNTLSNGGTFTAIDESNVDAVIFANDDITLNGAGTLSISSPAGHGIAGKDDVTITDGSYEINSSNTAIKAKAVYRRCRT